MSHLKKIIIIISFMIPVMASAQGTLSQEQKNRRIAEIISQSDINKAKKDVLMTIAPSNAEELAYFANCIKRVEYPKDNDTGMLYRIAIFNAFQDTLDLHLLSTIGKQKYLDLISSAYIMLFRSYDSTYTQEVIANSIELDKEEFLEWGEKTKLIREVTVELLLREYVDQLKKAGYNENRIIAKFLSIPEDKFYLAFAKEYRNMIVDLRYE